MADAAAASSDSDAMDATLELTLLSFEPLPSSSPSLFPSKSRPFAIAWIDPSLKKSTKTLNPKSPPIPKLHFTLSPPTLRNPTAALTVHVLAARLPFRPPKLVGATVLMLSSAPLAGEVLALQLRRPSGRVSGTIQVSVRVLWCLGCRSEDPMSPVVDVEPTAPPMPDAMRAAPPMPVVEEERGNEFGEDLRPRRMEGGRAWRSFLIGLASGTVAAVLVGAAGLAEV